MEPTAKEGATNLVAQLLMYVMSALDSRWNPSPILEMAAENSYPNTDLLDEYTATLCDTIGKMSEADKERIMYDGRFKQARQLADWWEDHQEWDKRRIASERKFKEGDRVQFLVEGTIFEVGDGRYQVDTPASPRYVWKQEDELEKVEG